MKFTNFPCSPFIYNFENKNLYLIPLHVFRHSASPRPTSRCSTRTTRRIWDTSALSPSPGPERRPTDQDSVHSSSDHPPAAAIQLSLIVLFLFYVRFFIIFLLFYVCFNCCLFLSYYRSNCYVCLRHYTKKKNSDCPYLWWWM